MIDFASAAASSDTSEVEDLPDQVLRKPGFRAAGMQVCDDGNREGAAILETLREVHSNIFAAACQLRIDRIKLYRRMRRFGVVLLPRSF